MVTLTKLARVMGEGAVPGRGASRFGRYRPRMAGLAVRRRYRSSSSSSTGLLAPTLELRDDRVVLGDRAEPSEIRTPRRRKVVADVTSEGNLPTEAELANRQRLHDEHTEYRLSLARDLAEKMTAAQFGDSVDEHVLADLAVRLQLASGYNDNLAKLAVTLREKRLSRKEIEKELRTVLEREAKRGRG